MTRVEVNEIHCPKCGGVSEYRSYSSVNAQISPDLAEKLIDGSLFDFVCPECKNKMTVFYSCLYNDMNAGMMIQLVSKGGEREVIEFLESMADDELLGSIAGMSTHRIVFSQNELREKALLLRDGFDDGIMEILKILVKHMATDNGMIRGDERLLYGSAGEDAIEVDIVTDELGYQGSLSVPMAVYNKIAQDLGENFGRDAGYFVDEAWAYEVLAKESVREEQP